jgi:hypothetical protein
VLAGFGTTDFAIVAIGRICCKTGFTTLADNSSFTVTAQFKLHNAVAAKPGSQSFRQGSATLAGTAGLPINQIWGWRGVAKRHKSANPNASV